MRSSKCVAGSILFLAIIAFSFTHAALAGPELSIEKEGEIDLGSTVAGQIKRGSFTVKNTGDSKLAITHYMATCSCLKITKSLTRDLQPGESGEFKFVFDTEGLAGKQARREVIIFSNAKTSPHRVTIKTKVNSRARYHVGPKKVAGEFAVLVDLRSSDSYAKSHVLGAINVPQNEFPSWVRSIPEDVTVYIYSEEGDISDEIAKSLNPKLPVRLKSLVGGYTQWKLSHPDYLTGKSEETGSD
ncbi:MAG: DUF1573 domain-containing protein [Candidatus Bipolaricaulia bacterium]